MKYKFNKFSWLFTSTLLICLSTTASASTKDNCPELLNFSAKKLHSKKVIDFCSQFNNKVLLVVNTASQCGFTPQFKQLEALYKKYKTQGLEIVGFPSDDFFQEHDSESETAEVCYVNYGVSFAMLSSSAVRGSDVNPFYKQLIEQSDTSPKWNFYKYLVDPQGKVTNVYSSREEPLGGELEKQIQQLLKTKI
ncbi:glutathione peroxidase [Catenovulum maritimum]|uniref:Glutathione peroxidase n=1 Tax=Catenovulum maritimum TaxID=1513271 RepID=A0A0J8GXI5_9ALTE|nr:glutathione peroxidase [Catenovulum maritimum]KMT65964.1 glutathione peroxidase [Catenovulum maritimum]